MTEPNTLEDSTALVNSVTLKFGSWCVKEQKTLEDSTALVHCDTSKELKMHAAHFKFAHMADDCKSQVTFAKDS
jgi:hypothetical protein